jgi:hypothetical protein
VDVSEGIEVVCLDLSARESNLQTLVLQIAWFSLRVDAKQEASDKVGTSSYRRAGPCGVCHSTE